MILPLRARHRAMITTLAVVAPAVFALALGKRSSVRPSPAPDLSTWNEPTLIPVGADWTVLLNPLVQARYLAVDTNSAPLAVALKTAAPVEAPDVLIYWAPSVGDSAALPPGATLLGPLPNPGVERYRLPFSGPPEGYLLLYSLAHRERLAIARLPAVPSRAPASP
jgi:hypothetical protein